MAGGVLKGFGGVFLTFGILLLLAGAGAAGYSAYDQKENEDQSGPLGVAEDRERSDQNEMLLYGGAAAAAVGLVLLIIGIVLLATGGSRARRAEMRAMLAGATRSDPTSVATPVAAGTAASAPLLVTKPQNATTPAAGSSRGKPVVVAAIILLALVAVVVAATVGFEGSAGNLLGLSDSEQPSGQQGFLGQVNSTGHMAESVSVLGMGQSRTTSAVPFTTAAGTGRVVLQVNWTAAVGGSEQLQVYLELEENGAWTLLAENTGASGVQVEFADAAKLSSASMRVRVFPGEDGASAGQDFEFTARFFR